MSTVAILGAGPLGGTLASTLALGSICSKVLIVDDAGPVAAGKALDVRQSCPIGGSDTQLTASRNPADAKNADVIVVADRAGDGNEWQGEAALSLLRRVFDNNPTAPVVLAGCSQGWLLERAILELGRSPRTIFGSAVHALEAGIRVVTGLEADQPARDVMLNVVGRPPKSLVVVWEAATIATRPALDRLEAGAIRRIESRAGALWPPGPYALASAAGFAIKTILAASGRSMTGLVVADYSQGAAVAVPVRLAASGIAEIAEPPSERRAKLALGLD
jgi:malate/lactate dehydrogenase